MSPRRGGNSSADPVGAGVKRAADVTGAALGLVVLAPVLAVVAALIRIILGPPVLFRQVRPGLNLRPFTLYKFRTMTDTRDSTGQLAPDGQRLTPLGRMLRSLSVDELPELVNVLTGDMSLVGPRPLLMKYEGRYSRRQLGRHNMRPGITGWAQVSGRNSVPWNERFELDLWYVENWTVRLDLRIIAMTVTRVLRRDGIQAKGHSTMPEFKGWDQV